MGTGNAPLFRRSILTSDQLERSRRDLGASGRDPDDDALAPAAVAGLQGRAHEVDVADALKGVVQAAVSHLNQYLVDDKIANETGAVATLTSPKSADCRHSATGVRPGCASARGPSG